MGGNEKTPLNMIRMCQMEVLPSKALDMGENLHLTIDYLLKNEY